MRELREWNAHVITSLLSGRSVGDRYPPVVPLPHLTFSGWLRLQRQWPLCGRREQDRWREKGGWGSRACRHKSSSRQRLPDRWLQHISQASGSARGDERPVRRRSSVTVTGRLEGVLVQVPPGRNYFVLKLTKTVYIWPNSKSRNRTFDSLLRCSNCDSTEKCFLWNYSHIRPPALKPLKSHNPPAEEDHE